TSSLSTLRVEGGENGKVYFDMIYRWAWDYMPTWTLHDLFVIAWTDDYDILPSSAQYWYRAYGNSGVDSKTKDTTQFTLESYAPGTGIGWKYDIISSFTDYYQGQEIGYAVNKHQGHGYVQITKVHDNSGTYESSSASATYFHKQLTVSPGFTFSATPQVGLTSSFGMDASPAATSQWFWLTSN